MTVIDSSTLLTYYSAQQSLSLARASRSTSSSSSSSSDSSTSTAPWDESSDESTIARDADVLSMTDYIDTSNVPKSAVSDDDKLEQDNQKLFAIYKALDTLQYLSEMAARDDVPSGVIDGYNTRFQDCLSQIEDYISSTTFNNIELQQTAIEAVTTGTAAVTSTSYGYTTGTLATSENINETVAGLSESDSFTISITKNGEQSDITISVGDIIDTYGTASLSNIVSYVNAKLADEGVNTRLKRVQTGTTTDEDDNTIYQYGLKIEYATNEEVSLSATSSSTALYVSGTTGLTESTDDTDANNKGRLVKLSLSDDETTSVFSVTSSSGGTSTADASVIDDEGNVYVIGTTTGNDEGEINQGSSDVYISKYDSAGTLLWSHLLGSGDTAEGYDLALDPTGGVVVVGSTTSNLTSTVAADNDNSYVTKFDEDGNQEWVTQLSTRSDNSALSVAVDADGNVTVGGTTSGVISSGETNAGKSDAYLLQLDSSGTITSRLQYGTTGNDEVAATAYGDDGSLYTVTIENGEAILSKYAVGEDGSVDISNGATYTKSLGTIGSSGAITDLLIDGDNIYIAGSTTNDLDTSDSSTPSGTDAFVYKLTDTGTTAEKDFVTYVGTSSKDTSGTLAVASDGTIYLSGTTTGTFEGQSRSEDGTNNAFIAAIDGSSGSIDWTKQYGGINGQSTGASIAIAEDNSSVLDVLGLPTGTVQTSTPVNSLTDSSTLKAGDTFQIEIDNGSATRTITITIDEGETMRSLVNKINARLGDSGTASIDYSSSGKSLQIEAASGTSLTLISGDDDSDALAGLGLAAGKLSSGDAITSSDGKTTYGLGLSSSLDFSTQSEAKAVKAQLNNVISALKEIYQKMNSGSDTTTTTTSSSSTASTASLSYLSARTTNASQALSLLA